MLNSNNPNLYGDGVRDDTDAIQQQLDSGLSTVYLPTPQKCYLISRPLMIHSDQELKLDRGTLVRLAPNSNCIMLTNADHSEGNHHITVTGGIWDMQNCLQAPNPMVNHTWYFRGFNQDNPVPYSPDLYMGILMRFINITHFTLSGVVFRDPVTFCVQLAKMTYFTIQDIIFDFKNWNPRPINMDGIHLDGCCRFGQIRNLHGQTFDDLVALNADDDDLSPCLGPIEDIQIDGIYSQDCHSAVRLLSKGSPVTNVSISHVFGTYHQYCIGFTKFVHKSQSDGIFRNISINNVFASKATRYEYYKLGGTQKPFIWMEQGIHVSNLSISNIYRDEREIAVPTVGVDKGATITNLSLRHVGFSNKTKTNTCLLNNEGTIMRLQLSDIETDQEVIINNGTIGSLSQ